MTKVRAHDGMIIEFSLQPVQLGAESEAQGRPIFEDREFITIRIPGDANTVVFREVEARDKEFYADEYEAWKKNEAVALKGTPLEEVAWLSKSKVQEFKNIEVHTLEDLAALSDTIISKLGTGGRSFVEKAKAHLQAASGGAALSETQAKLSEAQGEIERLKAQISEMNARFEELNKAKPKAA